MHDPVLNRASTDEARDLTRLLRACFDSIIDHLAPEALAFLREQCVRAERSAANVEIIATIDRRLAQIKGAPLRGS